MPETGHMTDTTVTSADGTEIAFERLGSGPAVILVASALADRSDARRLARLLAAAGRTVINYDRRGRGASGDAAGYAVEREIEDIAALIGHAGGPAALFGSSSGAVLALRAAAAGLDVERLALYEPPFAVDASGFGPPEGFGDRIGALLERGEHGRAVKAFMTEAQGMPALMVNAMRLIPGPWAAMKGMARTLPYDIAVMGDTQRGRPLDPAEWSSAACPALVLTGGKSPAGFHAAARALAEVLPDAEHRTLPGLNHGAVAMAPKRLAPALSAFLSGGR
ncbi:alpha/beta fold hydrolase [Actinomadura sp. 21ATH]|uniref:alpha/beta fold hydrolase n=1 Tax=Actinomadura sp. 21ATH TaxID=1735444 RepID=UPI0035BF7564